MVLTSSADSGNCPKQLNDWLWVFPPNKLFHGTRAWWIDSDPEPVLIDCPSVNKETTSLLKTFGEGRLPLIVLTSREAHGGVSELQEELGWPVLVQEQEGYLLPGLKKLLTFSEEYLTASGLRLLWTPGPTPGSSVVYAPAPWNVVFCGRLLIPLKLNQMAALRTRSTFHWTRQQKSLKKLRKWLPRDLRPSLASGAGAQSCGGGRLHKWEAWQDPQPL